MTTDSKKSQGTQENRKKTVDFNKKKFEKKTFELRLKKHNFANFFYIKNNS